MNCILTKKYNFQFEVDYKKKIKKLENILFEIMSRQKMLPSTVLIVTLMIILPVSRSKNLNDFSSKFFILFDKSFAKYKRIFNFLASGSNHNCKFGINNICAEGLECFQVFESDYTCAQSCNENWDCFRHRKSKKDLDGLDD